MAELPSDELQFILNSFSFLLWGALVMWMAAGFTMLEAGSVRTKNASVICLKNVGLYAVAAIAYYVIGYNLMYVDVGTVMGSVTFLRGPSSDELALLAGADGAREAVIGTEYAVMSDWFFQMVFVATAASIVSGALAERVKLWSFFVFTLVLTAVIYPIVGAWTWGGRLARRARLPGLRRIDHRPRYGRLRRAGRRARRRAAVRQVPGRRHGHRHAAVQRPGGHPWGSSSSGSAGSASTADRSSRSGVPPTCWR